MYDTCIRVGLAGFGHSGRLLHAPFIHAHPGFCLKKVYERSGNRAKEAYPETETVRSFEELLAEDIDLVVISTPNACHYPMAKAAIEAGKAVLVEKPAAITSAEAAELVTLAKERGVCFNVYQNRRFDGDFLTVKRLISEGRLGETVDYESHFDRFVVGKNAKPWKAAGGPSVNNLYDLGAHIIDQAYCLFGMPDEVYADLRKERAESNDWDNFEVILYYPDKKAILAAGELVLQPGPRYMVNGRQGTFIKYGMDVQEKALLRGERPPAAHWGEEPPEANGMLYTRGTDGTVLQERVGSEAGNYGSYYTALYESLTRGAPPVVNPEDCVNVLRIIEAAVESNRQKRRIAMK